MNFFEQNIADFQRRISRIEGNPDPKRLRSNRMYYELWRDHRRNQLRAWQEGKPFAVIPDCPRLFASMGFQCIQPTQTGDRAFGRAIGYMEMGRAADCPYYTCSRVQVAIGLLLSGDLPRPSLIAIDPLCEPRTQSMLWYGNHTGIPTFPLDTPRERNYAGIRYLADQLEEVIEYSEKHVPGVKLDLEKLATLQERDRIAEELFDEAVELRKSKPCPLSGQEGLRTPPFDLIHPGYLDWVHQYVAEIRERVEGGVGVVGHEAGRVMWLLGGPFYFDVFALFEKRDVTVPLYEEGLGVDFCRRIGDDEEFGRHLTPIEEEAALMLSLSWGLRAEYRVEAILRRCHEFEIDGLVHFNNYGCTPVLGTAFIVAEEARKRLGIPSLMLEGSCQDETRLDPKNADMQIGLFVEGMLVEKARRARSS